jgi:hypothetical protein
MVNLLVVVLFVMPFCVYGRIDYLFARTETKRAIMSLSLAGKTEEEMAKFYKFKEYPFNRIFQEFRSSGELQELIKKGRSK